MEYTKQQLVQAFCEATHSKVEDLKEIETSIQTQLDERRSALQKELDLLPTTARQQMKNIALNYLIKKQEDKIILDNSVVNL